LGGGALVDVVVVEEERGEPFLLLSSLLVFEEVELVVELVELAEVVFVFAKE
jgi:hypothetical protein